MSVELKAIAEAWACDHLRTGRPLRLAVSGLMGSGKTYAAESVVDMLNSVVRPAKRVSFGDVCRREWARRRQTRLEPDDPAWASIPTADLQAIGVELSGANGLGLVSQLDAVMSEDPTVDYVLDGGRRRAELRWLADRAGFSLVWVSSPHDLRLRRLLHRADRQDGDQESLLRDQMNHPLELEAAACYAVGMFHETWPNGWEPS